MGNWWVCDQAMCEWAKCSKNKKKHCQQNQNRSTHLTRSKIYHLAQLNGVRTNHSLIKQTKTDSTISSNHKTFKSHFNKPYKTNNNSSSNRTKLFLQFTTKIISQTTRTNNKKAVASSTCTYNKTCHFHLKIVMTLTTHPAL